MQFNPEEKKRLKAMVYFLIKRKAKESNNHCGFRLSEIEFILDELEQEGKIKKRPTINNHQYFINQ